MPASSMEGFLNALTVGGNPGMRVRDVMSTPVITAGPDDELATAATTMARRRIGALPVMDGGRLVAILTETDILRVLFRHRLFSSPEIESILLFAA